MRPHRRQPTRLPHPWDSPDKNTGVGCHFLLQCMKVKSESEVAQSWTAAHQTSQSMGFSRQELWSGVPLPSLKAWCSHKYTKKKMEDVVHTYNGHTKEWNNSIGSKWMDLQNIKLSEISQRKTNSIWCHFYVAYKTQYKWMHIPNRNKLTDKWSELLATNGERKQRGTNLGYGTKRHEMKKVS